MPGPNLVHSLTGYKLSRPLSAVLALFIFASAVWAQDLPGSIRGYKVHRDKITVSSADGVTSPAASVRVCEPRLLDAGLTGVTFGLPAELLAEKQSGKVDFLAFHEVKVNGIAVEVEEYRHAFDFRKGEKVALPRPARIFLPTTGIVSAVWSEMRDSKDTWTVTGRVFVFGRFRKYAMHHKRVVPVDFEITIKNPIRHD